MQIRYPRILTKKNFVRFLNRCLRDNREFKCYRCGRPFKLGDFIFKFRAKHDFYCYNCYNELYIDVSDNILDDRDKQYIETGEYPD